MADVFDDDLLKTLPSDPYFAGHQLASAFNDAHQIGKIPTGERNAKYAEALQMFQDYCSTNGLSVKTTVPSLSGNSNSNIGGIVTFFNTVRNELNPEVVSRRTQNEINEALTRGHERYTSLTGKGFAFQFSEQDVDQLQKLINKMRDLLQKTQEIDEDSRRRLLKRLEALQLELNRTMTSVDSIWSLCVDVDLVLRKAVLVAKGAHEVTKEVRETLTEIRKTAQEIIAIAAIAAAVAHGLPSNTQAPIQLPPPLLMPTNPTRPAQEEDGRA